MEKSSKKSNGKLLSLYGKLYKKFLIFYIIKLIKYLTIKINNYTMDLQFVIPGFYKKKGSDVTVGTADMIRIIGEDPKISDNFLTMDEKSLPEHYILQNYEFYPTFVNEAQSKIKLDKPKLGKIESITKKDTQNIPINTNNETKTFFDKSVTPGYTEDRIFLPKNPENNIKQTNPDELFIENILSKIKSKDKSKITLKFEIDLGLNVNTIIDSINMFDLDKHKVAKVILSKHEMQLMDLLYSEVSRIFDIKSNNHDDIFLEDDKNPVSDDEMEKKIKEHKDKKLMEAIEKINSDIDNIGQTYFQI